MKDMLIVVTGVINFINLICYGYLLYSEQYNKVDPYGLFIAIIIFIISCHIITYFLKEI